MNVSVIQRFKASLIDYLLIAGYLLSLMVLTVFIFPSLQSFFQGSLEVAQFTGFLMVTLPVTIYFAAFDSLGKGQTFGKRKMKIRVVTLDGQKPGLLRSAIRNLLKFVPWELSHFLVYRLMVLGNDPVPAFYMVVGGFVYVLMFSYLTTAIFSKRKQTLYDWFVKTQVVKSSS